MKSEYKIKMSKLMKDHLTKLGVYDEWLDNLRDEIEGNRILFNEDLNKKICDNVDYFVKVDSISNILRCIDWTQSKEGAYYWSELYNMLIDEGY